jgi:hypothetical protein
MRLFSVRLPPEPRAGEGHFPLDLPAAENNHEHNITRSEK